MLRYSRIIKLKNEFKRSDYIITIKRNYISIGRLQICDSIYCLRDKNSSGLTKSDRPRLTSTVKWPLGPLFLSHLRPVCIARPDFNKNVPVKESTVQDKQNASSSEECQEQLVVPKLNSLLRAHSRALRGSGQKQTLNNNSIENVVKKSETNLNQPTISKEAKVILNKLLQNNNENIPIHHSHDTAVGNVSNLEQKSVYAENTQSIQRSTNENHIIAQLSPADLRKYPLAKSTLHNFYQQLGEHLKAKELKITPEYKAQMAGKGLHHWMCTYRLKWPEEKAFSGIDFTKRDAATKAAVQALLWLQSLKKIDGQGRPVIYATEEINKMKQTMPIFSMTKSAEDKLVELIDKYDTCLSPHFEAVVNRERVVSENADADYNEFSDVFSKGPRQQQFLGPDVYLRRNPVSLPILKLRNEFLGLLENNSVVVVKGQPGCGKSTQAPQYILEEWAKNYVNYKDPCRIVVSQPRRIAAISLAARVANERNEEVGNIVGYQVRFKHAATRDTRIMYCTTGILLRYLQSDPILSSFSHVILDEAHERDVNTDLLMNLLRTAISKNTNLKLIIMSATIDTDIFQNYFKDAATLNVPGFTYPVKINFIEDFAADVNVSKSFKLTASSDPQVVHEDVARLIQHIHCTKDEGAILCFLPGWEDISKVKRLLPFRNDTYVLCLHSRLQDSEQRKIFSRPPPGVRKIILATNIAETSVTVDDVVYVIDTGVHKEERFDVEKGVTSIDNHWISKASMEQRKGRAGRVCPGESYHLYSKETFASFEKFSMPEILRTSLTKIVLDSKVYSNNMNAQKFFEELLCPPEPSAVKRAVEELEDLGLLDENENLTPLGRALSNFQLEPRLSRALVNAVVFRCVTPIVDIITLFSADTDMFARTLDDKRSMRRLKSEFSKDSDHLAQMCVLEMWLTYIENGDHYMANDFCTKNDLVPHKLQSLQKLRDVHFEYLHKGLKRIIPLSDDWSDNEEMVKAVLLSGTGLVLRRRNWDVVKGRVKKADVFLTRNNHKATITPDSINFDKCKKSKDKFFLYINEVRSNIRRTTVIRETSKISPLSVLLLMNKKLQFSKFDEAGDNEDNDDLVLLTLADTGIKYLCNKRHANILSKCKQALQNGLEYYIYQMTEGDTYDSKVNSDWNELLKCLGEALNNASVASSSSENTKTIK